MRSFFYFFIIIVVLQNIPENSSLPIVTSLTEDRMRLVSFLDFSSTSLSLAGNYTCTARSEVGSSERQALLQVKGE